MAYQKMEAMKQIGKLSQIFLPYSTSKYNELRSKKANY